MKKIPVFLAFISLLFSCVILMAQTATIQGKIQNNKFETVQLNLAYGNFDNFGTATINSEGNFILKANIKSHDIYTLTFSDNEKSLIVVAPNEKIDITLDADNLQDIIAVSGSESMQFCKEVIDLISAQKPLVDSFNTLLQNDRTQIFFNEFFSLFNKDFQLHKDADDAFVAFGKGVDTLDILTQKSFNKGKISAAHVDHYLVEANRLMKNIENEFATFSNSSSAEESYFDFYTQNVNILQNSRFFKADDVQNFKNNVEKYNELYQKRVDLASKEFEALYKVVVDLNRFRDDAKLNGALSKKGDKMELANRYFDFANNYTINVKDIGILYIQSVMEANQFSTAIVKTAQEAVTSVVNYYRQSYSDAENLRAAQLKDKIMANKDDIAVLMFLDLFKREQNISMHKEVVKALEAKYPTHWLVQERVKIEKSAPSSTAIGAEAPELEFPNPDGKMMKLSDLRGKVVLIDFWASWCRPCRMENPNVVKLYNQYKDKGFDVFSVSLDSSHDSWVAAIAADKLTWPNHVSDLKKWSSAGAKIYGVNSIPCTFLIDREGRILAKNLRGDALARALKEIFGE